MTKALSHLPCRIWNLIAEIFISNLKFPAGRWHTGNIPACEACRSIPAFAILAIMRGRLILGLALLSLLFSASAARADEIRLKDGTKIIGTIVGFENDSFRVETSYGFALIQKDKVADISIIATKKEPEPKPKANAPTAPSSAGDSKRSSRGRKGARRPCERFVGSKRACAAARPCQRCRLQCRRENGDSRTQDNKRGCRGACAARSAPSTAARSGAARDSR